MGRVAGNLRPVDTFAPAAAPPALRLVVAILTDAGAVDLVLARWAEHDVRGATVLDARGMAEHLSAHLSLFAGFKAAFAAVGHSQVVMTVIPASRCAEILALVVEAGDLRRPGTGIAFALDVADAVGLTKEQ